MGYNTEEIYQTESSWLKAADLQRKEHTVTIENVTLAEVGRDNEQKQRKLELHFVGRDKTLLLNKTNSDAISYAYSPDTDNWLGKQIVLYPTMVDFGGKAVEAIRVRPMLESATPPPGVPQGYQGASPDAVDNYEDVPF